jgi:hypothetical protein
MSKFGISVYENRPDDINAVYLTPDRFNVKGDGIHDDTDGIQEAILTVQKTTGYGIVFIPEGTYRISRTIHIGTACRLIGYGSRRPVMVLAESTPGFQTPDENDKGQARYMFWFTKSVPLPGEVIRDANPGTFYSAFSNIDISIEKGNPAAVALRTHYAQHCFVSHVDIRIGDGKAGIFDVGNEIENVRFFGGDYGIYTTKPSPGWPFMMVDTYFEGQRKAAIKTREAGLTIVRMEARDVPVVIETEPDYTEKLFMEDCRFININGSALIISNENNSHNQISLKNINLSDAPTLACFRQSGKTVKGAGAIYNVRSFIHGRQTDDIGKSPEIKTILDMAELHSLPEPADTDIPVLPPVSSWVNIKAHGAKGDGISDDTQAIRNAIENYRTIYLPQGIYRVTDTIVLKPDTILIGLNPISTRISILNNTEAFSGFGPPKPVVDVPGGGVNVITGIGIDTGARNTRAAGIRWKAGPSSYMNDVKFLGCHGSMQPGGGYSPIYNSSRTGDADVDNKWDSQYWSLWITDGGGGIFKDIWTASTYASAGIYISDTDTPGRIYAMSVEHHVRNEVRLKNVSNWKIYALQLEEEYAESPDCQPIEIENSSNVLFANLYLFRVIWVNTPYPQGIRTWNCRDIEFLNIHNFTQTKYPFNNILYDMTTGIEVRPWELTRLYISGNMKKILPEEKVQKLASGFEMIDAICRDSRGNIYFCDSRLKRIFRWSSEEERLDLVTDIHFKPLSLACDTIDHLLVVAEYLPSKGATINGEPEVYQNGEDAMGTSYSHWYSKGATVKVYSIDPDDPENTMKVLDKVPVSQISRIFKALYPANRWRDSSDFLPVSQNRAENCFVAPDKTGPLGATIIPVCYDLMRGVCLHEAYPGKLFYAVDEYIKRTYRFTVTEEGYLTNPVIFAEHGETNAATGEDGLIYIPDGEIYIYDTDGNNRGEITMPERPGCVMPDKTGRYLYVTARTSFYQVRLS